MSEWRCVIMHSRGVRDVGWIRLDGLGSASGRMYLRRENCESLSLSVLTTADRKFARAMFRMCRTLIFVFIPFSVFTLLVRRQEGHPACKQLGVGLLVMI